MDDHQKSRVIILAVCGVSLLAIGGGWMWTQNKKTDTAENDITSAGVPRQIASQVNLPGKPAGGNPPVQNVGPAPVTGSAAQPKPGPGNVPAPGNVAATGTAAQPKPAPGNVAATGTAAQPKPAPGNVAATGTAAQPKPAPGNVAATGTAAQPKPAPGNVARPVTANAKNPFIAKGNVLGLAGMSSDEPFQGSSAKTQTPPPAVQPSAIPAPYRATGSTTPEKNRYRATRREEATSVAKQVAGRKDPMAGIFEPLPYPAPWSRAGSERVATADTSAGANQNTEDGAEPTKVPPKVPPKDTEAAPNKGKIKIPPPPPTTEHLAPPVPPAPPTSAHNDAGNAAPLSIDIDKLPQPPDKPVVTPKLKLTAIVGNKAFLAVPLALRAQYKWPAVISLGPGERFEDPTNGSFSIVSVDRDSVTIEEEQERSVKNLPQIK